MEQKDVPCYYYFCGTANEKPTVHHLQVVLEEDITNPPATWRQSGREGKVRMSDFEAVMVPMATYAPAFQLSTPKKMKSPDEIRQEHEHAAHLGTLWHDNISSALQGTTPTVCPENEAAFRAFLELFPDVTASKK